MEEIIIHFCSVGEFEFQKAHNLLNSLIQRRDPSLRLSGFRSQSRLEKPESHSGRFVFLIDPESSLALGFISEFKNLLTV